MRPGVRRAWLAGLALAGGILIVGLAFWNSARLRPAAEALTILIGQCGGHWDGSPYSDGYDDMLRGLPATLGRQALVRITLDDIPAYDYDKHWFRLTDPVGRSILDQIAAADAAADASKPQSRAQLCYLGLVNDQPRFAGVMSGTIDDESSLDSPHIGVLHVWEADGWFNGRIMPYDAPITAGLYTLDTLRNWAKTPGGGTSAEVGAPYGTNYYSMVLPDSFELYTVLHDSGKLKNLLP